MPLPELARRARVRIHATIPEDTTINATARNRPGPRWTLRVLAAILVVFFLPIGYAVTAHYTVADVPLDWRTARRDSASLAPDPASTPEAVIHVYAANAARWRGAFGVHTWLATKPQGADRYTRFEVIGFGVTRGRPAVRVAPGVADGYWYGNAPVLLRELRGGDEVDAMIKRLHAAAADYPYNTTYRVWPGPNSNTFVAHLGRAVPELRLDLPPNAIGKDFLPEGGFVARAPSGSGVQVSLGGLLGVILSPEEGLEFNLLGLSAGFDPWPLALKLPGVGRVGFPTHTGGANSAPDPGLAARATEATD